MDGKDRNPRAWTAEEARGHAGRSMAGTARYWAEVRGRDSPTTLAGRLEGAGHSLCCLFDGNTLSVCPIAAAPIDALGSQASAGCRIDRGLSDEVERVLSTRGLGELAVAFGSLRIGAGEEDREDPSEPLFARMSAAAVRWARWAEGEGGSDLAACEGFALSMACVLEGRCEGFGGFALATAPCEADEEYHKAEGENWYERLPKEDPIGALDSCGSWRYDWLNGWGQGKAKAVRLGLEMAAFEEAEKLGRIVAPAAAAKPALRM
jgi:hypothetical protein